MKRALLVMLLASSATAYADSNDPTVKVLSTGTGAKQQLRMTGTVGFKRSVVMTMSMAMEMAVGTTKMPRTKIPDIRMPMSLEVTKVLPNGDIRYDFKVSTPEIIAGPDTNAAQIESEKKAMAPLGGLHGHVVVTNQGFTREADFDVPANIDATTKGFLDGAKQNFAQFATPLPTEAVGVGAKWVTTSKYNTNGMALVQAATNTVTALSGTTVSLDAKIEQHVASQKLEINGVAVEIKSFTGAGKGTMEFDLSQLMAKRASVSLDIKADMKSAGQQMSMAMDTTIGIADK